MNILPLASDETVEGTWTRRVEFLRGTALVNPVRSPSSARGWALEKKADKLWNGAL